MICDTCPYATIISENMLNDYGNVNRNTYVRCAKKRMDIEDGRQICSEYPEHPIPKGRSGLDRMIQNIMKMIGKGLK